jgi:hypothetical protein
VDLLYQEFCSPFSCPYILGVLWFLIFGCNVYRISVAFFLGVMASLAVSVR